MDSARQTELLEQIRDQQKKQLELAEAALANQREAIELSKTAQGLALRQLKVVPFLIIIALVMVLLILGLLLSMML